MKSIVTILGARPQFIKAKLVSEELRKSFNEIIIHTGQHYDDNMSDIFFRELELPNPDYNLGVGSGSHGEQTGLMLNLIERLLLKINPDMVLVYGDTNSTLAGAITAAKLNIPVAHVEAGLRSFNREMPEEINRILTDHISELLFAPTATAMGNLGKEGLSEKTFITGDVMFDMIEHYKPLIKTNYKDYYLATIHRPSNTDNPEKLNFILRNLNQLDKKVIFPKHPRTKVEGKWENIEFIEPVGYLDMLSLVVNAHKVITDSGGLQKETYILKKQCITLRNDTEWVETLHGNWNTLVTPDKIITTIYKEPIGNTKQIFGNGTASKQIVSHISEYLLKTC